MIEAINQTLPCCGYDNPEAVKWNPHNGVVQCHNCGQVYTPQRQQEPVRIMGFNCVCGRRMEVSAEQGVVPAPQRQWIGLTDAELAEFSDAKLGSYDLCLEVEAKLKEKNT